MYTEAKAKRLCRVLATIDAERAAAKDDAQEHKERIEELLDEARSLRMDLESKQEGLFPDPADEELGAPTMEALAETVDEGLLELPLEPSGITEKELNNRGTIRGDDDSSPIAVIEPATSPGIDAYEQGAEARMAGKPISDCPFEEGSYHGVSWLNGWTEFAEEDEQQGTGS